MRIVKIIAGILVALIIVIAAVVYFGLSNLNGFVEEIIETAGSKSLQTAVNVGGVNIDLLDGKGSINSLSIANPKGFSSNNIASVGNVSLQLDIKSLTGKVKVIKSISVDGVKLRAEQKGVTDTNLQALLDNIKSAAGGSSSSPKSGSPKSDSSSQIEVRLMVESLRFGESEIALETEQYGGKTIKLPAYTQNNIGNKITGLTPDQLSEAIVSNLIIKAEKAVKRKVREAAKDKAEEKLKEKLKEELGHKVSEEDVNKLKSLFK
jgi:hypothetical protein